MIYGLMGPKGIPRALVDTRSSAARKVLEIDKAHLLERYDKLGAEIGYLPVRRVRRQSSQTARFLLEDRQGW